MADRLISEEQAIDALLKAFAFHSYAGAMATNVIRQLPTIEAEPKHGHWKVLHGVLAGDDIYGDMGECSNCGLHLRNWEWNYCPNCGSRMDEVEE